MEELKERAQKLIEKLAIEEKRKQIRLLEAESIKPNFWQDHQLAGAKMKEMARLQKEIDEAEYLQLLIAEGKEAEAVTLLDDLETLLYLSGPYDEGSAILAIHSGQGGVEAM